MAAVGRKPDPDERLALSLAAATTAAAVHFGAGVYLLCSGSHMLITTSESAADRAIGDLVGRFDAKTPPQVIADAVLEHWGVA